MFILHYCITLSAAGWLSNDGKVNQFRGNSSSFFAKDAVSLLAHHSQVQSIHNIAISVTVLVVGWSRRRIVAKQLDKLRIHRCHIG